VPDVLARLWPRQGRAGPGAVEAALFHGQRRVGAGRQVGRDEDQRHHRAQHPGGLQPVERPQVHVLPTMEPQAFPVRREAPQPADVDDGRAVDIRSARVTNTQGAPGRAARIRGWPCRGRRRLSCLRRPARASAKRYTASRLAAPMRRSASRPGRSQPSGWAIPECIPRVIVRRGGRGSPVPTWSPRGSS
jgi:hypothetical protein